MATQRSKRTESVPLRKLGLENFQLRDFRTIFLSCERFLLPEKVEKGSYSLKESFTAGFPDPDKGEKGPITLTFEMTVQGHSFTEKEGKREAGAKSLEITLRGEALFEVVGRPNAPPSEVTKGLVRSLLAQVHPLAVKRIRDSAYEMGFRGFKPELGMDLLQASIKQIAD